MNAPPSPSAYESGAPYGQGETQETQGATQLASQGYESHSMNSHIFGYLQPLRPHAPRIDFLKLNPLVKIGRGPVPQVNDFSFPGMKISFQHCQIEWDGVETERSIVKVLDTSTNGTFVNGARISKGTSCILRDGNLLAFGSPQPQKDNESEDYRFIYRQLTGPIEQNGLQAKYDLAHELGSGTFATVMSAVEKATGEMWAVKIIHGSKVRGNASSKLHSFQREISILESLDHPNICRLKETFFGNPDANNDIYLVLEYVGGGDLLDYILKREGLDEPMSKHITRQICDALSYIHARNITHRDLKPENVLMTTDDPPIVKVADFGLAKAVDSLTMLRTMCGTPSYLAPEVVSQTDSAGYDHLVDSWSVGVIVFSMLTNTGPFLEDENEQDIRRKIAGRSIDWSTLQQHGVSPDGQDFIRRLLDVDPRTRMTLTEALSHPWLTEPEEPQPAAGLARTHSSFSEDSIDIPDISLPTGEDSMLSAMPSEDDIPVEGVHSLTIQSSPQAGPSNGGQPTSSTNMPGALPRSRLERRSQVLARTAAEEAQQAQRDVSASPENPEVVGSKRTRAAPRVGNGYGTPMDAINEDEEDEPQPKRNRLSDDAIPQLPAPRKKNNRNGNGAAAPAAATKAAPRVNGLLAPGKDEAAAVRRSPRNAGKASRH